MKALPKNLAKRIAKDYLRYENINQVTEELLAHRILADDLKSNKLEPIKEQSCQNKKKR